MDRPKGFEATCLALEIVPLRLVFGEKNVCLSDTGNNDRGTLVRGTGSRVV